MGISFNRRITGLDCMLQLANATNQLMVLLVEDDDLVAQALKRAFGLGKLTIERSDHGLRPGGEQPLKIFNTVFQLGNKPQDSLSALRIDPDDGTCAQHLGLPETQSVERPTGEENRGKTWQYGDASMYFISKDLSPVPE